VYGVHAQATIGLCGNQKRRVAVEFSIEHSSLIHRVRVPELECVVDNAKQTETAQSARIRIKLIAGHHHEPVADFDTVRASRERDGAGTRQHVCVQGGRQSAAMDTTVTLCVYNLGNHAAEKETHANSTRVGPGALGQQLHGGGTLAARTTQSLSLGW